MILDRGENHHAKLKLTYMATSESQGSEVDASLRQLRTEIKYLKIRCEKLAETDSESPDRFKSLEKKLYI